MPELISENNGHCFRDVKAKDIGQVLNSVRQELTFLNSSAEQDARVRVLLSNVIILSISETAEHNESSHQLISNLSVSHPSRFFIVDYNCKHQTSQAQLQASVGSRFVNAKNGAKTLTEEIYLSVSGDGVKVVPNLLLSHLAPDVPIITILLNDPRETEKLAHQETKEEDSLAFKSLLISMEEMSDVVIYDSSVFDDFRKGINALLSFKKVLAAKQSTEMVSSIGRPLKGGAQLAELRDISWRRTKRWRSLIAEHFDGALGENLPKSISALSFIYSTDSKDSRKEKLSGNVLLTAGWLFSALDLKIESAILEKGIITITSRTAFGTEVKAEFIPRKEIEPSSNSSSLRAVMLQFAEGKSQTALSFRIVPNHSLCEVNREKIVNGKPPQVLYSRRASFTESDNNQLILEELSSPVRDTIYREVRDCALELARVTQKLSSHS